MAILTANCNKAFVVSPIQSKKFLEHKTKETNTNKELTTKALAKIQVNNDKT